ncbi:hypothetical protein GCM10011519_31650 [Marmoricola endophyticus]|uniref:Uncharacterized protein n=1 Tax=Marmoricola endophyticus TaxID=2040280 RepID=A0A917BSU9_9ACTN|nr:DUF6297 family protein [Marmoricola endophyticus]GGF55438.1 hypothetical protein GCM10011519_31650 [Marmoricola endophyticus]
MSASQVRELRADVRHWRRGRASATLGQVLSDAYVGVFTAVVVGAMLASTVVGLRRELGVGCTAGDCAAGRDLLPWLVALGAVLAVLSLARLFGPVFVTPAVGSWLLTAPVDRTAVLRPRLLGAVGAAVVVAPVALVAATLGGLSPVAVAALTLGATVLAILGVAGAAVSQEREGRGGGLVAAAVGIVLWLLLLALATGRAPTRFLPTALWWPLVAVLAVLAAGLLGLALRGLAGVRHRQATAGGSLAPGVSGALASLDLALVHDLVIEHRWRAVESVRPARGGPGGVAALVWPDVVRLRRAPSRPVVLLASAVVAYAVATVGAGRLTVLVAAVVGFLAGLPMLSALRVLTRTPALVRMLPFPVSTARGATVVVPGALLLVWGLASVPALHTALGEPWGDSVLAGVGVAAAALAGAARWVTGRPPDYGRPLVSSPAGAVPTNLYASAFRGFDIAVLGVLPLLLLPEATGALLSVALSAGVLSYLLSRK